MSTLLKISVFILIFSSGHIVYSQCIDSTQISEINSCEDFASPNQFEFYYNPVCGCDGKTYYSPLCAFKSGITEWQMGPCDPCFDSLRANRIPFHFTVPPVPDYYPLPKSQVCGCDNKTYLHSKLAYKAGNTSWTKGSCACIDSSLIDLSIDFSACDSLIFEGYEFYHNGVDSNIRLIMGCDGKLYNNFCEAYHKHGVTRFVSLWDFDCHPLPEEERDTSFDCGTAYIPVCGCDWKTYQNACVAEKHFGIIDHYMGECNCADTTIIGNFNIFYGASGDQICQGASAYSAFQPVCGCDNKTYFNQCIAANLYGIPTFTLGPCQCIDSSLYDPTYICDTTSLVPYCGCDGNVYPNLCDAVFGNGVVGQRTCECIEPGLINDNIECNELFNYQPVCGCDGRTYPNACVATRKGGVTYYLPFACDDTCKDSVLILEEVPCSDFYEPVCGCDLVTYQNECHARYKNGVLKWDPGPCTLSSNTDKKTEINVSVYPNPTNGKLFLSGVSQGEYVIMNASGQVLVSGKQTPSLDISHLSPGIYFLRLFNEQKSFQSFKIIKM